MMEVNPVNASALNGSTEMEYLDNFESDNDILKELEKAINENAEAETTIKISNPISMNDDILKDFGDDFYDVTNANDVVPNETALLEETHASENNLNDGNFEATVLSDAQGENIQATEHNNKSPNHSDALAVEEPKIVDCAAFEPDKSVQNVEKEIENKLAIDQESVVSVSDKQNKANSVKNDEEEETSKASENSDEDDDDDVLDVMEGTGRYDDELEAADEEDNEEEVEEIEDDYSTDMTEEIGEEPPEKKRRKSNDSIQEGELLYKEDGTEESLVDENEKNETIEDENAQSVQENENEANAEENMENVKDKETNVEETEINEAKVEENEVTEVNVEENREAKSSSEENVENDQKNEVQENEDEVKKVIKNNEENSTENPDNVEKTEAADVEALDKNASIIQVIDSEETDKEKKEENPVEGVIDEILKCSETVEKEEEEEKQKEKDIKRPHSPDLLEESNKKSKSEDDDLEQPKEEKTVTSATKLEIPKLEPTDEKPKDELIMETKEELQLIPKLNLAEVVPVPIHFMQKFKKEVTEMSRQDLEEFVVTKLIQSISNQCVITDLRQQLQKQEGLLQSYQLKYQELNKQFNDLTMVTNRLGEDLSKNNKNYTTPVKITRAVGLQVGAASKSKPDSRFLKPIPAAAPARSPRLPAVPHHTYKSMGNSSPRASVSPQRMPLNAAQNQPNQAIRSAPPSPVNLIRTAVNPMTVAQIRNTVSPIVAQMRNVTNPVLTQVMRNVVSPGAAAAVAAASNTNGKLSPNKKKSTQKITPMRPVLTEAVQQLQQQQQKIQQEQLIKQQIAQIQNNKQLSVIPNHPPTTNVAFSPVGTPVRAPSPATAKTPIPIAPKPPVKDDSCIDLTDDDDKPKPTSVNGSTSTPRVPPLSPINNQQGVQPSNPGNRTGPPPHSPRMMQHASPNPRAMTQLPARYARPMVQRMPMPNGPMMNMRMPNGQVVNDPRRYNPNVQYKHPARLPTPGIQPSNPLWKLQPPKPQILRINNIDTGIVISWTMEDLSEKHSTIVSYQIYAYQETNAIPQMEMWRHVGDVKAMLLPMAVTLTQFQEGQRYHFAIRALDEHSRAGHFSAPRTWSET